MRHIAFLCNAASSLSNHGSDGGPEATWPRPAGSLAGAAPRSDDLSFLLAPLGFGPLGPPRGCHGGPRSLQHLLAEAGGGGGQEARGRKPPAGLGKFLKRPGRTSASTASSHSWPANVTCTRHDAFLNFLEGKACCAGSGAFDSRSSARHSRPLAAISSNVLVPRLPASALESRCASLPTARPEPERRATECRSRRDSNPVSTSRYTLAGDRSTGEPGIQEHTRERGAFSCLVVAFTEDLAIADLLKLALHGSSEAARPPGNRPETPGPECTNRLKPLTGTMSGSRLWRSTTSPSRHSPKMHTNEARARAGPGPRICSAIRRPGRARVSKKGPARLSGNFPDPYTPNPSAPKPFQP